jgi:hypothetical protein
MIFAEMQYGCTYEDVHPELDALLDEHFKSVESGLQGDSYFWILDGEEKVSIDTFTSMTHQVKSSKAGQLVKNVIGVLNSKYKMKVYDQPLLEGHEIF